MEFKAAICEDEADILNYIHQKLHSFFQQAHLPYQFFCFQSSVELTKAFSDGKGFDLYFLDIEMPELDGISLAKKIRSLNPDAIIVFISNKEELVFQSFEVRPFRFLRKNHFEEELPGFIIDLKKALTGQKKRSVVFENGSELISVSVSDLLYVEAMRKECVLHTTTGSITVKNKFSDTAEELSEHGFVQCHRSFLVNCRYIYSISRDGIVLDNKEILPVGRTHLEHVKEEFQSFIQEN